MTPPLPMVRNTDRRWPEDAPRGTFDIEPCQLADRAQVTARLFYICPNGRRCGVFMGPAAHDKRFKGDFHVWAWDGNADQPTLQPSINCVTIDEDGKPTGLCGWHGYVSAGRMK